MKLYNPFKWHISRIGKFYYVRRLRLLGWQYYDLQDGFPWYRDCYAYKYCRIPTLGMAVELLENAKDYGFVKQ